MAKLEDKVGYIENGQCLRNATFQELLVCPAGQVSSSLQELVDRCKELNATCPPVSTPSPVQLHPQKMHHSQIALFFARAVCPLVGFP